MMTMDMNHDAVFFFFVLSFEWMIEVLLLSFFLLMLEIPAVVSSCFFERRSGDGLEFACGNKYNVHRCF